MRILLVNQHPQDTVGGSEIQCDLIATHLARAGHAVVYFAVQGTQASYQVPYVVESGTFARGGFKKVLEKHRPDVVYWRLNRRHFLQSALLCKRMGIKFVFAVSSWGDLHKWAYRIKTDHLTFSEKLRIFYLHGRQSLATRFHYLGYYFVDGVVVQLEQQQHMLPGPRQIVIHNSVDATIAPFQWDKPFVAWIGTFKPIKNPELFIDLARHFQHTGIDFLMVGEIRGRYKQLLSRLSLPPNLHVLECRPHQEVNGMLQRALFLVQTSDTEGFPNVFIQAWAQGTPTIGLYYDPDGMVQKNNLGFISGSFDRLVKDTKVLLDGASLRKEMGQRAKQFAAEHFNPEQNIRKLEAFLDEVCEGR